MNRYSEKPFLRLIECYVLNLIDQLDNQQKATLIAMEPKLQSTYQMSGAWSEIVARSMNLNKDFDEQVLKFWKLYLEDARNKGVAVDPNEFSILFVDQNFSI